MGGRLRSEELLCLAARLYYVDGLSQADVARLINISQAKVSRVLTLARQKGIVRISVTDYDPRDYGLEAQLQQHLGLRQAIVIKTVKGLPTEELRQTLGHFAAPWVASLIPSQGVFAIAGGRTMQWLVHEMKPPAGVSGTTIVQAMGNIDSNVGPYDALELGRLLANRWNGTFLTLNTPVFVPDSRVRSQFLGLEPIRQVVQHLNRAEIAMVGVGSLVNSVFVERGVLSQKDVTRLIKAGAVGEICGRFYDAKGQECDTPYRSRVISIELERLRRTSEVVAVIAGSDRSEAILGAVKGRLVKSLVIDSAGAVALLAAAGH